MYKSISLFLLRLTIIVVFLSLALITGSLNMGTMLRLPVLHAAPDDGGTVVSNPAAGPCGRFEDVYYTSIDKETKDGIQFFACTVIGGTSIVGGYPCGGTNPDTGRAEPCVAPDNLPYFRPASNITRGQLAKIVVLSHAKGTTYGGAAHFVDVPVGSTFYHYVELAYVSDIVDEDYCTYNPPNPATCYFSPSKRATREEAAKAAVRGAGYTPVLPSSQTFVDVASTHRYFQEIEVGARRLLFGGYPCGGTNPQTAKSEPCDSQNTPYYRPGNYLTRSQFSKIDTNARFYHKGVAGYGNLVPYRGSPNFKYGAINLPNPDLRTVPSGQMDHYKFANEERYEASIEDIMYTQQAVDWFKNDPDAQPNGGTAIEIDLAIDPYGTHACPFGSSERMATSWNLPYGTVDFSAYKNCGVRFNFFTWSVTANAKYFAKTVWNATNGSGTSGRIQGYQLQESCNPTCGQDMIKADMLAAFCYSVGQGIIKCAAP